MQLVLDTNAMFHIKFLDRCYRCLVILKKKIQTYTNKRRSYFNTEKHVEQQ